LKAIEFSGNIETNGTIKVPKKFLSNLKNGSLRVIILVEEKDKLKKKVPFKERFKAVKLDTKGFKFDRNEANKR